MIYVFAFWSSLCSELIEWNHSTNATILPHSWWKSMSIATEAPRLAIYKRPLWTSGKLLWSMITFVQPQLAFFSGVLISAIAPKSNVSRLCWSHSVVSCRCRQLTISNQICNYASQYPKCHKVPSKRSYVVSGRPTVLPGATWAFLKDDLIKSRPYPSPHHGGCFSQVSGIRVGMIGQIGRCVSVRIGHDI